MATEDAQINKPRNGCLMALQTVIGAGFLIYLLIWSSNTYREWQATKQQKERAKQFDQVTDKWAEAAKLEAPMSLPERIAFKRSQVAYDIDKTVRVLHEMDRAMKERDSFEAYLQEAMQLDPNGVEPRVLEARAKVLKKLKEIFIEQRKLERAGALWPYASQMFVAVLDTFELDISPVGLGFGLDRDKARSAVSSIQSKLDEKAQLEDSIIEQEMALFQVVYDYANLYYDLIGEWDRVCLLRDRAYLAASAGEWGVVADTARQAIELAPYEREAYLLLARALIEKGGEGDLGTAGELLNSYVLYNPDYTAPALLLEGVRQQRLGDHKAASLSWQQATANYPRQAETLSDMLNPYRMRGYLRKSREGNMILQGYKNMMLGAGSFSPDIHLAALHFEKEEDGKAEAKVFDHFFRRRLQQQWDFVLADLAHCEGALGSDFDLIYTDESYLDLLVETKRRNRLSVAVENRSDQVLHNASLILCLHMTDMMQGDYVAFQVGKTLPMVAADGITEFGTIEVDMELFGVRKGVGDIVAQRAIVIAQEAVVWVDTDTYRIAEIERLRADHDARPPELDVDWFQSMRDTPDELVKGLLASAKVSVLNKWGKDSVAVELPKELAALRPVFRLLTKDKDTLAPVLDKLSKKGIKLQFDDTPFNAKDEPDKLSVAVDSPFGDIVLHFAQDENGKLGLADIDVRGDSPESVVPSP